MLDPLFVECNQVVMSVSFLNELLERVRYFPNAVES